MKNLVTLLVLVFVSFCLLAQKPCLPEGDATKEKKKEFNRQKNRPVDVKPNPKSVSIDSILKKGNDISRFNTTDYVVVEGFVVELKPGGPESCNCGSEEAKDHDIHIYMCRKMGAEKKDCFIVEITPLFRAIHIFDYDTLVGKKVKMTGYMFFDSEHKGNAVNTCKKCSNNWRKTSWEIHPVVKLEVVN